MGHLPALPPAGWYPDPVTGAGHRWWDGQAWSAATMPAEPAYAPPAVAEPAVQSPASDGSWSYFAGTTQPGTLPAAQPQLANHYAVPTRAVAQARPDNRYAFMTFAIVAAYIFIAMTTRFVFFGILPFWLSIRSRQLREPLAPLAIGAAILAVLVAVVALTSHH